MAVKKNNKSAEADFPFYIKRFGRYSELELELFF